MLEVAGRALKCWSGGGLGSERKRPLTTSGIRSTQVPPGPDPASQTGIQGQKVYLVERAQSGVVFAFCSAVTMTCPGTDAATDITTPSNLSLPLAAVRLQALAVSEPKRLNPFPLRQEKRTTIRPSMSARALRAATRIRSLTDVSRRRAQPLDI